MLSYSISVVIEAPLKYAFQWCTDFREDDPTIAGRQFGRHIIKRQGREFVWIQHYVRDGKESEGVRIVELHPPDAWENDAINEEKESFFTYKMSPLGKKRTRLTIRARVAYRTVEPEDVSALKEVLSADWAKYKAALEKDYASGRSARA